MLLILSNRWITWNSTSISLVNIWQIFYLLQINKRYPDRHVTVFHQGWPLLHKKHPKKQYYDIILVNTPDPLTAFLNRFYTLEFFQRGPENFKVRWRFDLFRLVRLLIYIGKEVGSYSGSLDRTLHEAFSMYCDTRPNQLLLYVTRTASFPNIGRKHHGTTIENLR